MILRHCRTGFTLVEVLVTTVIAALLLGLVLTAAQAVRAEAVRAKSLNRLRQIGVAVQHYLATQNGRVPLGPGPFYGLREYMEAERIIHFKRPWRGFATPEDAADSQTNHPYVPAFLSPADPTFPDQGMNGCASYAANGQVFGALDTIGQVSDGAANTVVFGERYANCNRTAILWGLYSSGCQAEYNGQPGPSPDIPCVNPPQRPPSFADPRIADVLPIVAAGSTGPSVAGVTFQVRPTAEHCDYRQLQTPHPGGMLTAYLDGSVRTTSPTVSPAVFWSAVTPAGGEVTPPE